MCGAEMACPKPRGDEGIMKKKTSNLNQAPSFKINDPTINKLTQAEKIVLEFAAGRLDKSADFFLERKLISKEMHDFIVALKKRRLLEFYND